jgi:hypothetical protein
MPNGKSHTYSDMLLRKLAGHWCGNPPTYPAQLVVLLQFVILDRDQTGWNTNEWATNSSGNMADARHWINAANFGRTSMARVCCDSQIASGIGVVITLKRVNSPV